MAHKLLPTSIQGQGLQLNVVGCKNLTDKEWFSRQDPYVIVEYGSNRFRTRTDKDGGKNPRFNEKFTVPIIEGLREATVHVWNSNTVSVDDFIGSARVLLEKVLSTGYDDSAWVLKSRTGRTAGEVNLILHFANAKPGKEDKLHGAGHYGSGYPPAAAGYAPSGVPSATHGQPPSYASGHTASTGYPPAHAAPTAYPAVRGTTSAYAPAPAAGYPPHSGYPPQQSYQSAHSGYPSSGYPPPAGYPPQQSSHSGYPPSGHSQSGYLPSGYPSDHSRYPSDPSRYPSDPSRYPSDPSRYSSDPSRYPSDPSRYPSDPSRTSHNSAAQPVPYPYPGAASPASEGYPSQYGTPPGGHNPGHYPSY